MLPQAHEVMAAWGFAYKSNFAWAKNRMGTGFWNRNKHELLLIGTRGHVPAPAMGTQAASLIEAPVRSHSEKPAVFYEIIERYFPTPPRSNCTRAAPSRGRDGTYGGWKRRSQSMSVNRASLMRE
jgi:N6-adenosine-specific RNA methylase IME4